MIMADHAFHKESSKHSNTPDEEEAFHNVQLTAEKSWVICNSSIKMQQIHQLYLNLTKSLQLFRMEMYLVAIGIYLEEKVCAACICICIWGDGKYL